MQRKRGQGATEFILVVALIGIATTGITSSYGDSVRSLFAASSDSVAGASQVSARAAASQTATGVRPTSKSLKNFANNHVDANQAGKPSGGGPG